MTPVILSYGLGVDSTAILLRWLHEPASRDFDLADLVVVTAMTGDEWDSTKADVEAYVLPLLREHGVRFIQVARDGRYVTKTAGVRTLDDSRQPVELFLSGDFKLSDEMLQAGTIPQSGGARLCSVHSKGDILDHTIEYVTQGRPYRHVIGFELNEPKRAAKDATFNTELRTGEYPLIEWGWDRQACLDYIEQLLGVVWTKSACVYCPFALNNTVSRALTLRRYTQTPSAGADALFMEEVALALNPAQGLMAGKALSAAVTEARLFGVLSAFMARLNAAPHAVYDVRRILRGRKDDPTKLANAARSVRAVAHGNREQMITLLEAEYGGRYRDGFYRAAVLERGEGFPAVERFYVVAPAVVHDKQHDRFESWWLELVDELELSAPKDTMTASDIRRSA